MSTTALRVWTGFFLFQWKNYLRQHRYLREIVVVVIFHIFFWGFLYDETPSDSIWIVFAVFGLLLNFITAPSLFFLEKGNTLYFLVGKPRGRLRFFFSKIALIVCIDLAIVAVFSLIYGIRFLAVDYFLYLPARLLLLALLLTLSTLCISFAFSARPQWTWLILLFLLLGSIVNKMAVFPITSLREGYKLLLLLLPPLQELAFMLVDFAADASRLGFFVWALGQIFLLGWLSFRLFQKKDLL